MGLSRIRRRFVIVQCADGRRRGYDLLYHADDRNTVFMCSADWDEAFQGTESPYDSFCLDSLLPVPVIKMGNSMYALLAHSALAEPQSIPFSTPLREMVGGGVSSVAPNRRPPPPPLPTYRRPPQPPSPIYSTSTPYVHVENPQPPPPPLPRARPTPSAPPLPPPYAPHFHLLYWMRRAPYFEPCVHFLQR